MHYKAGSIGRVILARFDHGEEIVPALGALCAKEKVASGWFFLFGAVTEGELVAGPRTADLPPDPVWKAFPMPHEIVGMGSIASRGREPSLHLHSSLGRGTEVLTGCIRKEGKVFLVVEAMLMELLGARATRARDERSGLELLSID